MTRRLRPGAARMSSTSTRFRRVWQWMTQNMLTGRTFKMINESATPRNVNEKKSRGRVGRSGRLAMLGFTMLELMVVMAIILILMGMAAGRYQRSILRSREAVLKQDLRVMRDAIQQYTLDKLTAPLSLTDLKDAGYLREIPTDPITQKQ